MKIGNPQNKIPSPVLTSKYGKVWAEAFRLRRGQFLSLEPSDSAEKGRLHSALWNSAKRHSLPFRVRCVSGKVWIERTA